MVLKAMQLLMTWQLITSCFLVLLCCDTAHLDAIRESKRVALSAVKPATVAIVTTATNASSTTVAGNIPSSTASSASMTTTKTITTTNKPPVPTATGTTKTTVRPHKASTFDAGSFCGGMVFALSLTLVLFLGYKFFCSRQETRYTSLEEHDAVI